MLSHVYYKQMAKWGSILIWENEESLNSTTISTPPLAFGINLPSSWNNCWLSVLPTHHEPRKWWCGHDFHILTKNGEPWRREGLAWAPLGRNFIFKVLHKENRDPKYGLILFLPRHGKLVSELLQFSWLTRLLLFQLLVLWDLNYQLGGILCF